MCSTPVSLAAHHSLWWLMQVVTAVVFLGTAVAASLETGHQNDDNKQLLFSPEDLLQFHLGKIDHESMLHTSTPTHWLKSRFHFSFADYYNPANEQFGVLRVMNDDLVQPRGGFGTHPHSEMEIATYVVDGALTHKDSMGTSETLGRGSVQFMTAGTGIQHSEYNHDSRKLLRFIQMWVVPHRSRLTPNYGSVRGEDIAPSRQNQFAHIVSPTQSAVPSSSSSKGAYLQLNQDVNMFAAELEPGKEARVTIGPGRQAYVLLVEGEGRASIGEKGGGRQGGGRNQQKAVDLVQHDGLEVINSHTDKPFDLICSAPSNSGIEGAHWLVVEMKNDGRGGRTKS